jgi:hypothetical protein
MIRYALACENGHSFESWFRDSAAFETQAAKNLVSCPHCASTRIEKQIMAPAIATRDAPERMSVASSGPDQEMRQMLRAFRAMVEANTDDVGTAFAEEARKIHYGEAEERAIRGAASPAEVRELREEGVEVAALPILPDERN